MDQSTCMPSQVPSHYEEGCPSAEAPLDGDAERAARHFPGASAASSLSLPDADDALSAAREVRTALAAPHSDREAALRRVCAGFTTTISPRSAARLAAHLSLSG